ncbi:GntR family transcriptional regulator [Poriferisphaera sp. WC338]|uniref:GntR family transcriptional regulator n=1 Tax=Poriferisphaera sp. WC338 TaxID=3425129 RepID=UPI003D81AA87
MSHQQKQTAYLRVADLIRQGIASGEYAQGDKLPSEHKLCQQYEISRITVRRALEILEQERLVLRRHGLGTFILERPVARQPVILGHEVDSSRSPLVFQVGQMHPEAASKQIAKEFQLPACMIVTIKRSGYREDQLVVYECIQILEEFVGKLKGYDFMMHNWLRRWQQLQMLPITHVAQQITAVPASVALASILEVEVGAPLLLERRFIQSDTNILARVVSYYPGESIRFDAVQQVNELQGNPASSSEEVAS